MLGYYQSIFITLHQSMQTRWITEVMAGNLALPSTEEMNKDINTFKTYCETYKPDYWIIPHLIPLRGQAD
jgi:hypothetical protein